MELSQRDKRQQEIHEQGFALVRQNSSKDSRTIKVNDKKLTNAIISLGDIITKGAKNLADKRVIYRALAENNIEVQRQISNYFYRTNGIYQKACNYYAFLYRYDWFVETEVLKDNLKSEKILKDFNNSLNFLNNSNIKIDCGDLALGVIVNGAYYGYIVDLPDRVTLQALPLKYCRSRYKIGNQAAVEFNMRYFDECFSDIAYRMKVLKLFPEEFSKGYVAFKQGKLLADSADPTQKDGWYLLDPDRTVKFSFYGDTIADSPIFINAIPSIIDLDEAQALDRQKMMQELLKILVQKLPRDKNGDLIFDITEAKDLHNTAVEMLSGSVGVDVFTTFADIEAINLSDKSTSTTSDDLEKVERTVYNSLGMAQSVFNPSGNLSLTNSIKQDESFMRNLLLQFGKFYDRILDRRNSNKDKYRFNFHFLETTQFNYQDLAKLYKEQSTQGYSKMLTQIALGVPQSTIINAAYFENSILELHKIMIPNLTSSTMSAETILDKTGQNNNDKSQETTEGTAGRPSLPDSEKSDKTLQNNESLS